MSRLTYRLVTNDKELEAAFAIRREVFVEEQGISESEEWDGRDMDALHVVAKDGQRVVGTARVLFLTENQAKVERMAILKPFRHKGVGHGIVSFLDQMLQGKKITQIVLHAQYQVIDFYRSCGFEETGSPFWEAGIKHVKMLKRI